jgi:hypothetical protein
MEGSILTIAARMVNLEDRCSWLMLGKMFAYESLLFLSSGLET